MLKKFFKRFEAALTLSIISLLLVLGLSGSFASHVKAQPAQSYLDYPPVTYRLMTDKSGVSNPVQICASVGVSKPRLDLTKAIYAHRLFGYDEDSKKEIWIHQRYLNVNQEELKSPLYSQPPSYQLFDSYLEIGGSEGQKRRNGLISFCNGR
jgi:hypothetical protein